MTNNNPGMSHTFGKVTNFDTFNLKSTDQIIQHISKLPPNGIIYS